MKKIYIVITQTGTALSIISGILTNKKYNHASIAMDKELNQLYSFGRLNPYNPFWGGFVHEGIYHGTFKRFKNTIALIYEKEVSDEQYELMMNEIKKIEVHKEEYHFNVLGLLMVLFNKKIIKDKTMYCAEFVYHILEVGKVDLSKVNYIVKPEDFKNIDGLELVYNGKLNEYDNRNTKYLEKYENKFIEMFIKIFKYQKNVVSLGITAFLNLFKYF